MRDLARLIKVPETTYREWEYGRAIRGEPYIKIARALGVVIDRNSNPANLCGLWVGADTGPWRSSSVVPGDSNNAFDLNGGNGDIDNDNRSDNNDDNAVRCVRSR